MVLFSVSTNNYHMNTLDWHLVLTRLVQYFQENMRVSKSADIFQRHKPAILFNDKWN